MNQNKSNSIKTDRKEIEQILNKIKLKEVNGLDVTKEWDRVFYLISLHPAKQKDVAKYSEDYTETTLSVLGEPLSDIPLGRVIQITSAAEHKLTDVETAFMSYKKQGITNDELKEEYHVFSSVIVFLCRILCEYGDKTSTCIPELDKTDAYKDNVVIDIVSATNDERINAILKTFDCYKCLLSILRNGITNDDKQIMSAVSFNLEILDMYVNNLITYLCKAENASDN